MAKAKKQQSIFDFQNTQELPCVDLCDDDSSILCPICSKNMAVWAMDDRIKHVEECLSLLSIRLETGDAPVEAPSFQEKVELVKVRKVETEPVVKKRKVELGAAQKERLKYINAAPKIKKEKPVTVESEEVPKELLPSSRKTPIPQLKILTFRPTKETEYEISVDAFCYKPHELIQQYFLSHFHSDHYGGITKRWCSERTIDSKIVYCSVVTARLLTIKFKVDPEFIFSLETNKRYKVWGYDCEIDGGFETDDKTPGLYVTSVDANHCPGAVIFLFESVSLAGESTYILHCGDFRVNRAMMEHPALKPFHVNGQLQLEKVYLDTTYMSPKYNFPKQEVVCACVADMFCQLSQEDKLFNTWFGTSLQSRITDFLSLATQKKKKFLILVGTYLIGKEKLAIAILRKLSNCPIYISNINSRGDKMEIVRAYSDTYLDLVITENELGDDGDAVVHLVPMKIVGTAQELSNYFNHNQYFKHFERCVGLRPTGWSFQDKNNDEPGAENGIPVEAQEVPLMATLNVLRSVPEYSYLDILRQNPSKASRKLDKGIYRIYSLPYSEHLSFRELSFFVVFLNIGRVIPTVNTENEWSSARMAEIIKQWETVRAVKQGSKFDLPQGVASVIQDLTLDNF